MTMVVSTRQRLFYRFEGEKGAYLLLHHGLFGSHLDWYEAGYVDALRDEFRLIVMDARGHGRSDHPLDPEDYNLAALADDVVAIMDALDIRNLHFCGYSLGALVGFELLMRHPDRVRIAMLAGESPFVGDVAREHWRELAGLVEREGLTAARERWAGEQRPVAGAGAAEQEGEQPAALALLEALAREETRPDEGRISVDSPVALFVGEADPALERVRDARRRIHRARFVSFPGQSHAGLFRERTALMEEMLRLLRPSRRPGEGAPGGTRRGRGEGASSRAQRGADEPPLASAPLTPPPPVEVPSAPADVPAPPAAEEADARPGPAADDAADTQPGPAADDAAEAQPGPAADNQADAQPADAADVQTDEDAADAPHSGHDERDGPRAGAEQPAEEADDEEEDPAP